MFALEETRHATVVIESLSFDEEVVYNTKYHELLKLWHPKQVYTWGVVALLITPMQCYRRCLIWCMVLAPTKPHYSLGTRFQSLGNDWGRVVRWR